MGKSVKSTPVRPLSPIFTRVKLARLSRLFDEYQLVSGFANIISEQTDCYFDLEIENHFKYGIFFGQVPFTSHNIS